MSPKREKAAVPVPQRLILGCVLAFTGGFLDIYTYLIRGGVFANAQTSNLIFLGLRLMEGDWPQALNYFAQVASYVVGILVAGVVKRRHVPKGTIRRTNGIAVTSPRTNTASILFHSISETSFCVNTFSKNVQKNTASIRHERMLYFIFI